MNIRAYKKQAIALLLLLVFLLFSFCSYLYIIRPLIAPKRAPAETWMTVFVHGTFGTTLGLFSMFNVIKGNVENTSYKKITSHMRYDPYFHQLQAILEPGLYAVTPTFTPPQTKNKPCALPLAAAYQSLTDYISPGTENQLFYTFGWSGLMSQQRRRKEAIRFYNMLAVEYKKLQERGITPKIRIIAHSHGGNVVLNLAGVDALARSNAAPTKQEFPDPDHLTSMQELYTLFEKTSTPEAARTKHNQKKWDYRPTPVPFTIDELIVLGTPLQPETTPFFLSPFFKNIFNVYSAGDTIQGMDWVSTRRYYSDQRLPCLPVDVSSQPNVRQIKIMMNKPTVTKKTVETDEPEQPSIMGTLSTLWRSLMHEKNASTQPDPSHKELWFVAWDATERMLHAQEHIKPYPYAIFIPFLQALVAEHPTLKDVDVRIKFGKDKVSFISYEHDSLKKEKKIILPQVLLSGLQKKIAPWRPDNVTVHDQMNILHRYTKMISIT